jgi:zinc transport system substrate-binding protein
METRETLMGTTNFRFIIIMVAVLVPSLLFPPGRPRAAEPPAVVVSILPIHSLVAGVMQGVGEPTLIVKGAGSPHSYALRPSEAAALQKAAVVFWVGVDLETFLRKPLEALPRSARRVELAQLPGISLLPYRTGDAWSALDHHHDQADGKSGIHAHEAGNTARSPGEFDMHIWLDPANAKAMVAAMVATLSDVDPAHAETYRNNGQKVSAQLDRLDEELRATLAGARGKPYVVFHDAYQYFERRYGLTPVGSVTLSPERQPGAYWMSQMRDKIVARGTLCVFREPQFAPAWIDTLTRGTAARLATLDPIGADQQPGPGAYFDLMRRLARALAACLG